MFLQYFVHIPTCFFGLNHNLTKMGGIYFSDGWLDHHQVKIGMVVQQLRCAGSHGRGDFFGGGGF